MIFKCVHTVYMRNERSETGIGDGSKTIRWGKDWRISALCVDNLLLCGELEERSEGERK